MASAPARVPVQPVLDAVLWLSRQSRSRNLPRRSQDAQHNAGEGIPAICASPDKQLRAIVVVAPSTFQMPLPAVPRILRLSNLHRTFRWSGQEIDAASTFGQRYPTRYPFALAPREAPEKSATRSAGISDPGGRRNRPLQGPAQAREITTAPPVRTDAGTRDRFQRHLAIRARGQHD